MTPIARRVAVLTSIAAATLGLGRAAPPPAEPVPVTVYHPDPHHLWNRLHRALWVRTGPDGKDYGHDRLDPLLWPETRYLLKGSLHDQAVEVLDEFLANEGEKLLTDPLKRAILQRDLWAVFDWAAEPGRNSREAYLRRSPPARRALLLRLARVIKRLALTAEQIHGLPDNYAAAVATRAFSEKYDPDHPERAFLPPDLFQPDGPWVEVEVDNSSAVTATRHVHDFGARSAFRVFLRFPEGRSATLAYFARLRDFPQHWLVTREPGRRQETRTLNPDLPQFPAGTQAALVRQMLLVDREGRLAVTRVTENVQLRVFREVPRLTAEGVGRRETPSGQEFYEFTRSRELLFAGKTGGLRSLGPNDRDFHTQLLILPADEFEAKDNQPLPKGESPFERVQARTLQSCVGCHDRPGIHSFRSYTGGDYPRGEYYLPDLSETRDADAQGQLSGLRKRAQYDWGLLQGLWEDAPRR
jgi:hypothetical protein